MYIIRWYCHCISILSFRKLLHFFPPFASYFYVCIPLFFYHNIIYVSAWAKRMMKMIVMLCVRYVSVCVKSVFELFFPSLSLSRFYFTILFIYQTNIQRFVYLVRVIVSLSSIWWWFIATVFEKTVKKMTTKTTTEETNATNSFLNCDAKQWKWKWMLTNKNEQKHPHARNEHCSSEKRKKNNSSRILFLCYIVAHSRSNGCINKITASIQYAIDDESETRERERKRIRKPTSLNL